MEAAAEAAIELAGGVIEDRRDGEGRREEGMADDRGAPGAGDR